MKAYVYDKRTGNKIEVIDNVVNVLTAINEVYIVDNKYVTHHYNRRDVKTTIYQN